MIDRVTPAVVNINTRTRVQVRDPFFDDPVFRRFFNMPNQPRERVQQSLGSGVIVVQPRACADQQPRHRVPTTLP
jgi:S1-C subfamily serine protease